MVSIILALLFFGPSVCAPSGGSFRRRRRRRSPCLTFLLIYHLRFVIRKREAASRNLGLQTGREIRQGVDDDRARTSAPTRMGTAQTIFSEDVFEFPSVNEVQRDRYRLRRTLVTSFWDDDDDDPASCAFR